MLLLIYFRFPKICHLISALSLLKRSPITEHVYLAFCCYRSYHNNGPMTSCFHTYLGSDFHEEIAKVTLLNQLISIYLDTSNLTTLQKGCTYIIIHGCWIIGSTSPLFLPTSNISLFKSSPIFTCQSASLDFIFYICEMEIIELLSLGFPY